MHAATRQAQATAAGVTLPPVVPHVTVNYARPPQRGGARGRSSRGSGRAGRSGKQLQHKGGAGKVAEQAARTTPYVRTRIGPRNIAPSRVVIKTTGNTAVQRRDRSHINPRWDSHFVDMSDGDDRPATLSRGTGMNSKNHKLIFLCSRCRGKVETSHFFMLTYTHVTL